MEDTLQAGYSPVAACGPESSRSQLQTGAEYLFCMAVTPSMSDRTRFLTWQDGSAATS